MSSRRGGWINVEGLTAKKVTVFLNTLKAIQETNGKDDFFEETKKNQGFFLSNTSRNMGHVS